MTKPLQIIHVNQQVIRRNLKHKTCNPPIMIRRKRRKTSIPVVYCHEADLMLDGKVVGRLVYRPDHPLDCGARLWLETDTLDIRPRSNLETSTSNT